MTPNVTTITEMLLLNGNSNSYQQKNHILDDDGMVLFAKVRQQLYANNHRKNQQNKEHTIILSFSSAFDEEPPLTVPAVLEHPTYHLYTTLVGDAVGVIVNEIDTQTQSAMAYNSIAFDDNNRP